MNDDADKFIRISVWHEVVLVLLLCFGWPTALSLFEFFAYDAVTSIDFTDADLLALVVSELILGAICVGFLYLRDFKVWREIQFRPSRREHLIFIGLFIGSAGSYALLFNLVCTAIGVENLTIPKFTQSASLPFAVAVSTVNPIFEEVFVVGYLFERLKGIAPWILITISTILRVSYHLYQGWVGIVAILPMGILFAVTYWKTRNLWSLVLAHAVLDFTGL